MLSYMDFVEMTRKYKRTQLLFSIAEHSSKVSEPTTDPQVWRELSPWALASVAKAAIYMANDQRSVALVSVHELTRLCMAYANVPTLRPDETNTSLILLRLAYEQFRFMTSDLEEWCRTVAIFELMPEKHQHLAHLKHLGESVFGLPANQVIFIHDIISGTAKLSSGSWDDEVFSQAGFRELTINIGISKCISLRQSLTSDIEQIKASAETSALRSSTASQMDPNPLENHPILNIDGSFVVPIPRMLNFNCTPGGFVENGFRKFGNSFSREVGHLVESYVGDLLKQITGAIIHREREIGTKANPQKTIDWFVELPNLTLLVEVKSTRPMPHIRNGSVDPETAYEPSFAKAFSQIAKTMDYIDRNGPALADLQRTNIVSLLVTLEPFYLGNSGLFADKPENVFIVSTRELESLVQLSAEEISSRFLNLKIENPESSHDLLHSLKLNEVGALNPLTIEARARHPAFLVMNTDQGRN